MQKAIVLIPERRKDICFGSIWQYNVYPTNWIPQRNTGVFSAVIDRDIDDVRTIYFIYSEGVKIKALRRRLQRNELSSDKV